MRVLIIGSSGQDGRILWEQLQEEGHELAGVSRSLVRTLRDPLPAVDIGSERDVRCLIEDFAPIGSFSLPPTITAPKIPLAETASFGT